MFMEKLKTNQCFFNPATEYMRTEDGNEMRPLSIHIGTDAMGKPTYEEAVFDVARFRKANAAFRAGSIDREQLLESPWLRTEWDEAAKIRNDELKYGKSYVNSPFRQASGVINSGDFTAINVIQLLGEILGEDNRDYVLEQAVTTVATPNLTLSVDQFSGFGGSTDVAEGQEPLVKKGAYSRTEYMLKKQAAAIAITDEGAMRYERDVWAQHIRQAQITLRRDFNQKIATELETATDISKGDWLAWTTDHRTRDAGRDIWDAISTIEGNGGRVDTIASHPRVFNDFVTNTAGPLAAGQNQMTNAKVVNNISTLGGVTWYLDSLKTATLATVYDRSAVLNFQGPTKTEQFRIPGKMINVYQTVNFNNIKIVDSTRIRDITAVSAP